MNSMFLHNYHSHTARCGHATGEDREYVEAAIENGFKTIGFSDHVMLPGVHMPGIRGDINQLEEYVNSVLSLREEFKDKIDVKLGFECEYLHEPFDSYYKDLRQRYPFDYFILGQHSFFDLSVYQMRWYDTIKDRSAMLDKYADDAIAGMKSGMFLYFAHPDFLVYIYGNWDENCERVSRRICQAAKEFGIPLELNMTRTRGKNRHLLWKEESFMYPYPKFWAIAKDYDVDVIVGVDAHSPKDYYISDYEAFAEILRKTGLHWLPDNEIIKLRK